MLLISPDIDVPQISPARLLLVIYNFSDVAYLSKLLETCGIVLLSALLDHVAKVQLLYLIKELWRCLYFAELGFAIDVLVGLSSFFYLLDDSLCLLRNGIISILLLLLFLGKVVTNHVVILLGNCCSHTWRGDDALLLIVGLV